jgi:MSHA pilin protein MshC
MTIGIAAYPACRADDSGFTLIELITVTVIISILAAFVAPHLSMSREFAARGFDDQTKAILRFAQKSAVAQHKYVCVAFSVNQIELSVSAVPVCPGSALISADGNAVTRLTAPQDVVFATVPIDFYFDALGRPGLGSTQRLRVFGMPGDIVIEAETGYVH